MISIETKVKRKGHIKRISSKDKGQMEEIIRSGGTITKSHQQNSPRGVRTVKRTTRQKIVHESLGLVSSVDKWDIRLPTVSRE